MRPAIDALVSDSPSDKPLRLHILVKELNGDTSALKNDLGDYIDSLPSVGKNRFDVVEITAFDYIQ